MEGGYLRTQGSVADLEERSQGCIVTGRQTDPRGGE